MSTRKRNSFRTVMVGVLLSLNSLSALHGQTADQVLKVDVNLVQVDVQVLQKKTSRAVGSLSKDDFQVYENGVPQRIATISRDQLPLSVVLLFDLTWSVNPVLKSLASGALDALKHLKAEDEVAVVVYAKKAQVLQEFTTNREKVVEAIEKAGEMVSDDPAFFNEAVYQGSTLLAKATNPERRRTIIWLTDNVPNIPSTKQHSEKEAFQEVLETGTVVFTLLERSGRSDTMAVAYGKNPLLVPFRLHNPPGDVYKYAERTGGDVMKSNKEEVSSKLAQLIDEIRTRYTIGYYPSVKEGKGKFCEIKVEINPQVIAREGAMTVRAKTGYYR